MISRLRAWPPLVGLGAAFLVLSILLNLDYPVDDLFSWRLLLPSIDVGLLLVPLALAARSGKRLLFWTTASIWALFLLLRLLRIADTAVPMFLDRSFNLYIDSGYLFGLYDLLTTSSHQGDFLLLAAAGLLAAIGAGAVSWYAWGLATRAFAIGRIRLWSLGGAGLMLGAALLWGWRPAQPPALFRLAQEIWSIRQQTRHQQAFAVRLEQTTRDRATNPITLNGLGGADVLLFIVESYGRVAFSQPRFRQPMETTMDKLGTTLAQHGFAAVSSYLVSSTYGGSSWLAHGTLESGVRVTNDLEDAALLRSSLPPMASYFRQSGYRTVWVMPGTRFAFPEGSYFDFEQAYYASDFNYRGPTFGWSPMPDQFVLDWVRRREFVQPQQPLFACYVLVSSHAAFNIQPPYIQDWETIKDGSLYQGREIYFPFYWRNLKDAGDAYVHSLDYDFTLLGDYLARYVTADSLIIILGDHQPPVQLTGTGEPWSVPIHIISRNPRLLDPFRKRGYTPGLVPTQPPPHPGMETFLPGFLEDFR
jgi:hypothetical protein